MKATARAGEAVERLGSGLDVVYAVIALIFYVISASRAAILRLYTGLALWFCWSGVDRLLIPGC